MGRKDAERLLLNPGNHRGTFLVRESETTKGDDRFFVNTVESQSGRIYVRYPELKSLVIYFMIFMKHNNLFGI